MADCSWLQRTATWPRLGLLTAAVMLGTALFSLREAATWQGVRGKREKAPDGRFEGYDDRELRRYFDAIGPHGVQLYVDTQLTLDLLFPLAYGSLCVGVLARTFPCRTRWVWVPVSVSLTDLGENLLLVILAWRFQYSHSSEWAATVSVASWFTVAKWWLSGLGLVVGVVAVGLRLFSWLRQFVRWLRRRRA